MLNPIISNNISKFNFGKNSQTGMQLPLVVYDKFWYTIKLLLASVICAFALAENSKEGVIGTMLISPLAVPVVGLVTALLACQWMDSLVNFCILVVSCVFLLVCGYIVGYVYRSESPTVEMKQRYSDVTVRNTIIAFLIGIVLSMSLLSVGTNKQGFGTMELVGAAIAIAMLPPLVNAGLTYSNRKVEVPERNEYTWNSIKLALYNIIGLAMGTIVAFLAWYMSRRKI